MLTSGTLASRRMTSLLLLKILSYTVGALKVLKSAAVVVMWYVSFYLELKLARIMYLLKYINSS